MKFSIITATFNSAKTLLFSINSLRDQRCKNLEYIIIDGGSTDGTVEIIKQNQDIVTKWVSAPDNGIYFALNKGINLATGDIISFLHSDDFFPDNNALTKIEQKFLQGNYDGVYGDLKYVSSVNSQKIIRNWKAGNYNDRKQLKNGWMPPHPALFLKKEVYQKYGVFNTSLKIASDYEIMMRLLWKHSVTLGYIPEALIYMRMGGKSNSLSNIILKMKEDYKVITSLKIGGIYVLFRKNFRKIPQFFS